MHKAEVFALAEHYGVPHDEYYRESQDLCFFPEKTPQDFLKRHLAADLRPGEIVRRDGTVVGQHRGLALYTVGQRRGLGVGGLKIPLEVVAKDADGNRLVVAERGAEPAHEVTLTDLHWISWRPPEESEEPFTARLRSLGTPVNGTLRYRGSAGRFAFSTPQGPQAWGQHVVLYRGEEVVGGGQMSG
jgi:tRNA-specific 2-thiouridylase